MATVFFVNRIRTCKFQTALTRIYRDGSKLCSRTIACERDVEKSPEETLEMQEVQKKQEHTITTASANWSPLIFKCGKLAKLADGCVTVTLHDTTVMATAVSKEKTLASQFVPLNVLYQQKAAALGRIPLNFLRRELVQSESEILISRMIDRSLRPLFPDQFNWETQIICNPLAMDGNNFPDILSINAASAALAVSDIPWDGPVGAVRVGLTDNNVIINPDKRALEKSSLNLVVVSKARNYLVMLEGSCSNVVLPEFMKALKVGVKECQTIIKAIKQLRIEHGKPKRAFEKAEMDAELYKKIESLSTEPLREIFEDYTHSKISRDIAIMNLQNSIWEKLKESFNNASDVSAIFSTICKKVFRDLIFEKDIRCDGRSLEMLRNIQCEVDLFKPLHGSALFQRGYTQVLCKVALDSPNSALKMDRVSMLTSGLKEKNFFVHYEFPPFATNDVGRVGPIGRREIGHGSLAEKALRANIPENFPFTIRLTSEVLESNGSSSMATVCGGTLALLDAGIPLKNGCAGVAMGIVTKWSEDDPSEVEDYRIMTDLLGIEDYFGDMDFKVAGTKKHITAVQMDVKTNGLPIKLVMESLHLAKRAISTILNEMASVCSQPRENSKENWPVMERMMVPVHLRSKFIGPSGMNVKKLEMDMGVEVTEESPGEFHLFASNKTVMKEAMEEIKSLLEGFQEPVLEFGGVYEATVVEIREHGCLVTLYPNMQPVLIHISQLDHKKVSHPSALGIEVGHRIQVKYFGRDPVSGMMRLSRKVLQRTGSEVVQSFFKGDSRREKDQYQLKEEAEEEKNQ